MEKRLIESCVRCIILCVVLIGCSAAPDDLGISVSTSGDYNITVQGRIWLKSAPTFFIVENQTFSAANGTLKIGGTYAFSGTDEFGPWQSTKFAYDVWAGVDATIRVYHDQPFIVFTQQYPLSANNTRAANYEDVISGFPGFRMEGESGHLGYLSYGGMMFGDTSLRYGQWYNGTQFINDGITAGPLAIFDEEGHTLIISPISNFMAASMSHDQPQGGNMYWGIMGGVNNLPFQYQVDFIVYYGESIHEAFEGWGSVLRQMYGKDPSMQQQDWTLSYLGYWTDNGAFYYYNTETNKTYEETIIDVISYSDLTLNLRYRYVQYDSWWYYKGEGDGVKNWTARPDVFPNGFPNLYMKTGLPSAAHNRYWASDTVYAKQNGGNYDFIIDEQMALPVDWGFWMDLFEGAKSWDLILYEQDWLNVQFSGVRALLEDVSLGATWLNQMGLAAEYKNIFIQYCMANPRHVMHALQLPMVTQARVSNDYSPGGQQWKIGVSSIFAEAMGIAPFKDTFWTTQTQTGNPYGPDHQERYSGLNSAVSTLSTGPVGPGDKIGSTNKAVLIRCCNADGLILKPSKPARAIDKQIIKAAFPGSEGPDGEVWVARTEISGLRFANVLAADLQSTFNMGTEDLGFAPQGESYYAAAYNSPEGWQVFSNATPIILTNSCIPERFCLYHVAQKIPNWSETALFGDFGKWVPMSPQRVNKIEWTAQNLIATLSGAPMENFRFWYILGGKMGSVQCSLDTRGQGSFRILGYLGTAVCS